jgi:hypothetical protein
VARFNRVLVIGSATCAIAFAALVVVFNLFPAVTSFFPDATLFILFGATLLFGGLQYWSVTHGSVADIAGVRVLYFDSAHPNFVAAVRRRYRLDQPV